jgi:hypothetical protein
LPLAYPASVQRFFESTTTNLGLRDAWAKARFGGQPDYDAPDDGLASDEDLRRFVTAELGNSIAPREQIEATLRRIQAGEPLQTGVLSTLLAVNRWLGAPGSTTPANRNPVRE